MSTSLAAVPFFTLVMVNGKTHPFADSVAFTLNYSLTQCGSLLCMTEIEA